MELTCHHKHLHQDGLQQHWPCDEDARVWRNHDRRARAHSMLQQMSCARPDAALQQGRQTPRLQKPLQQRLFWVHEPMQASFQAFCLISAEWALVLQQGDHLGRGRLRARVLQQTLRCPAKDCV